LLQQSKMEEIKEVSLTYISGRQISLSPEKALVILSGKREDFINDKVNPGKTLFDNGKIKITEKGETLTFTQDDKIKEFKNRADMIKNRYYKSLYDVLVLDKMKQW